MGPRAASLKDSEEIGEATERLVGERSILAGMPSVHLSGFELEGPGGLAELVHRGDRDRQFLPDTVGYLRRRRPGISLPELAPLLLLFL